MVVVVVEVEDFSVGPPKPPGGRVLLAGFLHAKRFHIVDVYLFINSTLN